MIPYFIMLAAFLADRLTKWWASAYFAKHGPTRFSWFFTLGQTYNQGIAFGLLPGIGRWVGWLTVAVIVGMALYLSQVPKSMWLARAGLALIIGGAMGNLVDRVTTGKVLDFIVTPIRPGIFNVADLLINVGLILAVLGAFLQGSAVAADSAGSGHLETDPLQAGLD